jgi:thiol-disulfide isomerase/thioredoxin
LLFGPEGLGSDLDAPGPGPAEEERMRVLRSVRCVAGLVGVSGLVFGGLKSGAGIEPARAEGPAPASEIRAPEFSAGLTWLNTPHPLTMAELRGKVVLVDFWEYTCVNCIRTLPYLKAWNERYKDKGLVIIGVHTPEFHFAREAANVARAVKEFGLTYPIIVDSDQAVWNAYSNRYWPAKYLVDAKGFVRATHFGEGSYGDTEQTIQGLLREANPSVSLPTILEPVRGEDRPGAVCYPVTPELYAGYLRGALGNTEGYSPGKLVSFRDPGGYRDGLLYARGSWLNEPEALIHTRKRAQPDDYIAIRYHAIQVNTVLKPEQSRPVRLYVTQDGKPVSKQDKGDDLRYTEDGRSYLLVEQPRMYSVIKNAKWGAHTLKLATADEGVGLYSFTFASCTVGGE